MGKKSPSPPAAPDPVKTAAAQTASNKETAYWNAVLNNVNQNTPYGSIAYTQNDVSPDYDMNAYNSAVAAYGTGGGVWNDINGGTSSRKPTMAMFDRNAGKPPQFTSTVNLSPES